MKWFNVMTNELFYDELFEKNLSLILPKIILEQTLLILQSKSGLSRHLSLKNQKVNIQKKSVIGPVWIDL
jgi:hypothetical protein